MKLIKNFYDYDVVVMPQVATGDFTDFGMAMDDNELYIISPSADKPIKMVVEGSDFSDVQDFVQNANLVSNATIGKRWACEAITNSIAGCLQFV